MSNIELTDWFGFIWSCCHWIYFKNGKNCTSKDILMVSQQHLEQFRQLKIGFGPYLFGPFSVHTQALIAIVFLAVDYGN